MSDLLLPVVALLVLLSGVLLFCSRRLRQATGMPAARVISADTSGWRRCEQPLWSAEHRLTGRPDYLVESGVSTIPVEVKSGRRPTRLYDSHVRQLAAYCLLVEDTWGRTVPYGLLHYDDVTVQVEFTEELRQELLSALDEMRRLRHNDDVPRSHEERSRCARCGLRDGCDQRLDG